jgi:PPOX class probable F420-dependent enzyme
VAQTPDPRLLAVVAANRWGVLATIKRDGRPQLTNVGYSWDDGLIRISVTADRVKTRNLQRDPRLVLHVMGRGRRGHGGVGPVPGPALSLRRVGRTGSFCYRGTAGEHEDRDDYRRAMVADRRLVIRFRPEHTCGQPPRD